MPDGKSQSMKILGSLNTPASDTPVSEGTQLVMNNLEFAPDEPKEFGPIMILVIGSVISMIAQYCMYKHMHQIAKSPNMLQRFTLRGYIKKACDDKDFFRQHKDRIYNAIIQAGSKATPEQIENIFKDNK